MQWCITSVTISMQNKTISIVNVYLGDNKVNKSVPTAALPDVCLRWEDAKIKGWLGRGGERCKLWRWRKGNGTMQSADRMGGNGRDRWSPSGARGQRSSGDWLCWSSLLFISLLFILHPLTPSHSPRQLRHSLRTHSHCAVIQPDSTLRLVFCVHCVFF